MIKEFIKVICKNNKYKNILSNKIYYTNNITFIGIKVIYYYIYDLNKKFIDCYDKNDFTTLDEFREQRLNKIFND